MDPYDTNEWICFACGRVAECHPYRVMDAIRNDSPVFDALLLAYRYQTRLVCMGCIQQAGPLLTCPNCKTATEEGWYTKCHICTGPRPWGTRPVPREGTHAARADCRCWFRREITWVNDTIMTAAITHIEEAQRHTTLRQRMMASIQNKRSRDKKKEQIRAWWADPANADAIRTHARRAAERGEKRESNAALKEMKACRRLLRRVRKALENPEPEALRSLQQELRLPTSSPGSCRPSSPT